MRREPILRNVAAETQTGGLRSQVRIDRQNMGRLGVSMQNVDDILNDAFGQRQISTIYTQSNQYRVILEASEQYQRDPKALEKLYVAAPGGGPQTPLANHRAYRQRLRPAVGLPSGAVSGGDDQLRSRARRVARRRVAGHRADRKRYSHAVDRSSARSAATRRSFASRSPASPISFSRRSSRSMSCWASFTRASRIPSPCSRPCPRRASARLLALMLFRLDMSIVALIGIVLLMGIVKKNAIMMIDFALEMERFEGLSPEVSIVRACHLRFRPIMMTTLAALARRAAAGARAWFGKRIARPARHLHRRRPAAVANAHPLYDARHLSRRRAAARAAGRRAGGGRGGRSLRRRRRGPCRERKEAAE